MNPSGWNLSVTAVREVAFDGFNHVCVAPVIHHGRHVVNDVLVCGEVFET